MALNGWHRGEHAIHRKLGTEGDYSVANLYMAIDGELPGDHAEFHSTRLSFLPVTTLDGEGRPWGSVLAGKQGFVRAPRYSVLSVNAELWDGEPLLQNSKLFEDGKDMLVAGIGIELSTRRRNKFAGKITKLEFQTELPGNNMSLDLTVNQAIGNCPKYITIRDLIPHPNTSPHVAHQDLHLTPNGQLPNEVIRMITAADTVFLGTSYHAYSQEARRFPSHVGMNHRGGRPGFIRVAPGDSRTVVLPDYSGNRFMTSLGNIEATSLASLTFIDFVTGDILYLTGDAENLVGEQALELMPFQKALTTVYVTGYTLVRDALPVRQRAGAERSPYSPPIRLLAAESSHSIFSNQTAHPTALLTRIDIHSPTIATFTWSSSIELRVLPGQAIIMDMAPLVGIPAYRHMAPGKPTSVNDDSVRTWTISSVFGRRAAPAATAHTTTEYSLTLREKRGGAVTGALFAIARKLKEVRPEALEDASGLQLRVGIVGVVGEFVLPDVTEDGIRDEELGLQVQVLHSDPRPTKLLWIAGGIGLTPFLSMLRALRLPSSVTDVRFILATAEPEVLVPLVLDAYGDSHVQLTLDVFTRQSSFTYDAPTLTRVNINVHHNRLPPDLFIRHVDADDLKERVVYLCGSPDFEKAAMGALVAGGVNEGTVKREGFEY
ncbi:hypothetical protein C8F01DRAFT_1238127 [Mycena amicta]|nr:hypothetical protein C8F01DRAFT_1238127 [Mycena amicta]